MFGQQLCSYVAAGRRRLRQRQPVADIDGVCRQRLAEPGQADPRQRLEQHFAPSIGFSYAVPRLRNTVIRGGYGINYSAAPDFLAYNSALGSFPGNSLNVTQTTFNVTGGYLDLAKAVANQKASVPAVHGRSVPFQPVPLNGVRQPDGHDYWLRRRLEDSIHPELQPLDPAGTDEDFNV